MDEAAVRKEFEREWAPWTAALGTIPPSRTREPGVCGPWSVHDVVGHVHAYVRYHLAHARAAFSHAVPGTWDAMGDRAPVTGNVGGLHARNEALRVAGLSVSWQQLVDEAAWLRTQTFEWTGTLTSEQLDEQVGWVDFWDPDFPGRPDDLPIHIRRLAEVPTARMPMPVWQFVLPDKPPDRHVTEHLAQLRAWLGE